MEIIKTYGNKMLRIFLKFIMKMKSKKIPKLCTIIYETQIKC